MTIEKFMEFWDNWSPIWYNSARCCVVDNPHEIYHVKEKCRIPYTAATNVYSKYQKLKAATKGAYFALREGEQPEAIKLSKYKRGAVLIEAVLESNCLEYYEQEENEDPYLLKERLAFYLGITSIIQSLAGGNINALVQPTKENPTPGSIYKFDELDIEREQDADDFLQSVYKDLYFARMLGNYNVLTMANLLGVLTERASLLSTIIKPKQEQ